MTSRIAIFALALTLATGGYGLRADDKDAKPAPAPKADAPRPDSKDERKDDKGPRPDRPPGPPGPGGPGDRPDRSWGPRPDGSSRGDWGSRSRVLDQFSADELREMIRAVEGTNNKKLAEKVKARFEEAIARKPQQLTQQQLDEAMAVFEDREPYLAKRLKESLAKDPQRVSAMLAMQWPRLEKPIELRKTDPQLYNAQTAEILRQGEARGITWRLHHAIKEKNEAEAAKLKDELKVKLVEQHQARQAIRKLEHARLNDQIQKLSAEITAEEEKSAEAIEKHFKELVRFAETGPRERGKGDRPDRGEKPEKKEPEKTEERD
jgi:hypothetical protein